MDAAYIRRHDKGTYMNITTYGETVTKIVCRQFRLDINIRKLHEQTFMLNSEMNWTVQSTTINIRTCHMPSSNHTHLRVTQSQY